METLSKAPPNPVAAGAGAAVLKPTIAPAVTSIGSVGGGGSSGGAGEKATDTAVQPLRGPAFVITNVSQSQHFIKMLAYAEYGVGKTYLMGTAVDVPSMRDVILLNAEGGHLTYNDDAHEFGVIDSARVTTYKQASRFYEFLKLHCHLRDRTDQAAKDKMRELQDQLMPGIIEPERLRRYYTVITDSLTELETYCMNQLLGVNDATKIDEEVAGAEWAEYKKQHMMVQRLVRNFRDLPMHVLFTCARSYTQDEMKRHLYGPMLTGKLASQVQGFMDVVGYLVMGAPKEDNSEPDRRLYVRPSPRWQAKSRFSKFKGGHFDNPTMASILTEVGILPKGTPLLLPEKSTPQAGKK